MRKGHRRYESWKNDGFAGWLNSHLQARDWTASQLAREAGVGQTLVSRWMSGRQLPSAESLAALARGLNIDILEALAAAGYISDRPVTSDVRVMELHTRLDAVAQNGGINHELYLMLTGLLVDFGQPMSTRPPEHIPVTVQEVRRADLDYLPDNRPHGDAARSQSATEIRESRVSYAPRQSL